ncbi:hypothetical protein CC79DRAFT_1363957 [Sarocladium strictum]
MAQRKPDRFDSDSSDAESMHITHPVSHNRAPEPWFPPPPTAAVAEREKKRPRVITREKPRPVEDIPPLPPLTNFPPPPPEPVDMPPMPRRVKSQRKTVMGILDGWWDLNLLEKRQTMFGGANAGRKA